MMMAVRLATIRAAESGPRAVRNGALPDISAGARLLVAREARRRVLLVAREARRRVLLVLSRSHRHLPGSAACRPPSPCAGAELNYGNYQHIRLRHNPSTQRCHG